MLTIKTIQDLERLHRELRITEDLRQLMEKMLCELHEAHEPETDLDLFSLQRYGPIYVLEKEQDDARYLKELGPPDEERNTPHCQPEWVERIGEKWWRMGILSDNDYLFQVIIPAHGFGEEVEAWLTELAAEEMYLGPSSSNEVAAGHELDNLDPNPSDQKIKISY